MKIKNGEKIQNDNDLQIPPSPFSKIEEKDEKSYENDPPEREKNEAKKRDDEGGGSSYSGLLNFLYFEFREVFHCFRLIYFYIYYSNT